MAVTREQILQYTGGSNKGADILAASKKYGFTPADVDAAFGRTVGTSQSWINQNAPAAAPAPVSAPSAPQNYQQRLFDIRANAPDRATAVQQISDFANQNNLNSSQIAGAFGTDIANVGNHAQEFGVTINADIPKQPAPSSAASFQPTPAKGANPTFTPSTYQEVALDQGDNNQWAAEASNRMTNPNISNPLGKQTISYGPDGTPTVSQSLSPELQGLYAKALQGLEKPLGEYRFSKVDDPTVGGMESVIQALREREQPRFDRAKSQLENDLLVRGFNPGTEGYNARMDDLSRAENDFSLGLYNIGGQEQSRLFDLQTANRGREIGEAITSRALPISEISSLVGAVNPALPNQPFQGRGFDPAPIYQAFADAGLFDLGREGTRIQGEIETRRTDAQKKEANRGILDTFLNAFNPFG